MTTAVSGLLKIGNTGSDQYKNRMYLLESNGYQNVTALKKAFAIEVEDYDGKETLLHEIFDKSRVGDTERRKPVTWGSFLRCSLLNHFEN